MDVDLAVSKTAYRDDPEAAAAGMAMPDHAQDIAAHYPEKTGARALTYRKKKLLVEWICLSLSVGILIVGIVMKALPGSSAKCAAESASGGGGGGGGGAAASYSGGSGAAPDVSSGSSWLKTGQEMFGPLQENANVDGGFGYDVAASGDGTLLAVLQQGQPGSIEIKSWDGTQWTPEAVIQAPPNSYTKPANVADERQALVMSRNGHVVAFSQGDVVFVYQKEDTGDDASSWQPVGQHLKNSNAKQYGAALAISDNGKMLAISAESRDQEHRGFIQVWELVKYPDNEWKKVGSDIAGNRYGGTLAMNEDGTRVAVGTFQSNLNTIESWTGVVRVFRFVQGAGDDDDNDDDEDSLVGEWQMLGQSLPGSSYTHSVSLDGRGDLVAIGTEDEEDHYAAVYKLFSDDSTFMWEPVGASVTGPSLANLGAAVAISEDGSVMAVGAPGTPSASDPAQRVGKVHIYQYDGSNNVWQAVGDPIESTSSADNFGKCLAMSALGGRVVIGAPNRDVGDLENVGQVTVFTWGRP